MWFPLPWSSGLTSQTFTAPADALRQRPDSPAYPGRDRILIYAEANRDFAVLQSFSPHTQNRSVFAIQLGEAIHHGSVDLLLNEDVKLIWREISKVQKTTLVRSFRPDHAKRHLALVTNAIMLFPNHVMKHTVQPGEKLIERPFRSRQACWQILTEIVFNRSL